MIRALLGMNAGSRGTMPQEGELFKVTHLGGKTFEIRYGFYEECDRYAQHAEPIEVYPDFIKQPQYTEEGIPFVTAIQNPCEYFEGGKDENSSCEECSFYQHGEELLGVCVCPMRILGERQDE